MTNEVNEATEATETTEIKEVNPEEKNLLTACTLGSIIGFIVPLVIWILKKDTVSVYARKFMTSMLNFELTILIFWFVAGLIPLLGGLLMSVLFIFNLIICIIAFNAASNHKEYKFPIIFNLLK
ncbi:MAG: DUF4870 domain-containing protein [Alphaproteobacteria bacterium]|nr:DUF4870 domain-containing protein [Alphaproteobacteria bacterium]